MALFGDGATFVLPPGCSSPGGRCLPTFSDGATFVLPPGAIAGVSSRRAKPGDSITLYDVGFGSVTPNIPAGQVVQQTNTLAAQLHVLFGQTEATVGYDGLAPNAVGGRVSIQRGCAERCGERHRTPDIRPRGRHGDADAIHCNTQLIGCYVD